MTTTTHNPFDETHWASCLRENLTSSSYGEGLETGRASAKAPRQSLTRQLDFGCLKTTLGLDVLRCRTPAMIEKELWVYLLAYNLIRLLMAQAAALSAQAPRQLSFKHTVQLWNAWHSRGLGRASQADPTLLFALIAQVRVGHRPGRCEPRARKRRPKSFPWLKVPRPVARRRNPNHPTWLRVTQQSRI